MKRIYLVLTILATMTIAAEANMFPAEILQEATFEAVAAKRSSLATSALNKLSSDQVSALVSIMADTQKMNSRSSSWKKKLADLKKVLAEMKNHPKFQKAKWMAADGSTFDNYADYHEHQWGTPPPGGGGSNPF